VSTLGVKYTDRNVIRVLRALAERIETVEAESES
jgi:hypothetical protein